MSVKSDTGSTTGALSSIEERSFDHVPEDERHGQPRQVFYMWFGISATIFSLVTGFVGITLGLSFWWTLLSIVIGNVLVPGATTVEHLKQLVADARKQG